MLKVVHLFFFLRLGRKKRVVRCNAHGFIAGGVYEYPSGGGWTSSKEYYSSLLASLEVRAALHCHAAYLSKPMSTPRVPDCIVGPTKRSSSLAQSLSPSLMRLFCSPRMFP